MQFIPNINEEFENISGDFSSIEILAPETRQILIDFRDSSADTINWTLTIDEVRSVMGLATPKFVVAEYCMAVFKYNTTQ